MTAGHWSRLRAKGGGPRGGGKGALKGPLRKIVRHRKLYTVSVLPHGAAPHWKNYQEILVTEDYFLSRDRLRDEVASSRWKDVKFSESGWREVLECGHDQPPVQDLIGETNAVSRRCAKCKAGKPPDVLPSKEDV